MAVKSTRSPLITQPPPTIVPPPTTTTTMPPGTTTTIRSRLIFPRSHHHTQVTKLIVLHKTLQNICINKDNNLSCEREGIWEKKLNTGFSNKRCYLNIKE
ncbi:unnamed protein product [Ceratitis capitata]|uniref:(Mediterranean fruit fly) hypothetical protein n=1 Tax=Ceratitis capitata TaxID=7213 RepID=A0A811UUI6_CERCA|nr:unnamed protein product [Ceratitis capitata]